MSGCGAQRAARRRAAGRPGGAGHAGALGDPRQPDGADPLQRVRRRPGPQGDGDAQRRRRVRRQRLPDRRAHRPARSSTDDDAAAGLQPLRQPVQHGGAAGHPARRDPADPQDPRLRDRLPPAGARRRRLRALLRREGRRQGRRGEPRRAARHRRHLERRDAQVLSLPHARRRRRLLRRAGQHLAQVPDAPPGARRGRAHHLGLRRAPPSRPADPEDAHRRRLGLRDRHADHGRGQRRHRGGRAARASTATTSASATPTATRPPTATCRASPRRERRA